jgi:hypothetical protein
MLGCIYSSYTQMIATHADGGGGRSTCAPAAAEADEPDGVSEAAGAAWAAWGGGCRPETTGPVVRPAGRHPDRQTGTSFDSQPDGPTDAPRGRPSGVNAACSQARRAGTRPSASDLCMKSDSGKLLFRGLLAT